ncbi:MAG TPA: hypothetical protein P5069_02580 [Candidatus Hydrogenedentes bacterium]|nr:hypothetical protein [Candidatus Hydrogenedentota bacterium]
MTPFLRRLLVILAAAGGVSAAAQLLPPAAPQDPGGAPPPVLCAVTAVCGVNPPVAAPPADDRLAALEGVLKPLGFAGYEFIGTTARELAPGQETRFPINATYSAAVTLLPQQEGDAASMEVRIDALLDGKIVNALAGTVQARPGDTVVFRGMPLAPGELVVLLARPSEQSSDQSKSGEQDQQEQEQKQPQEEQQEEQQEQQEEKEKDQEQQPAEEEQGDGAEEEAKEMENESLHALLESLEETDKREQKEIRNVRQRIDFKGGWW